MVQKSTSNGALVAIVLILIYLFCYAKIKSRNDEGMQLEVLGTEHGTLGKKSRISTTEPHVLATITILLFD